MQKQFTIEYAENGYILRLGRDIRKCLDTVEVEITFTDRRGCE